MRDWKIDPKLLCNRHLLGNHFEIHKAVGNLRNSGKWTKALTKKGYLEPQNFVKRHNRLVEGMIKRKMKHNSPLNIDGIDLLRGYININKSVRDLSKRCVDCRKRINGKF